MVRKATTNDVQAIFEIIEHFSKKGVMLRRTASEITESLREFFVFEENGFIRGVAALYIWSAELGEIRSLAVKDEYARRGIGSRLVRACVDEALAIGVKKVFALTYKTAFFEKLGFKQVEKALLPQKIWGDCIDCVKFPSCDETAVIMELK